MREGNRKLNRWPGYNYSWAGYYFVTICTQNRTPWFGRVQNGQMVLNEYGKIVQECWTDLPNHYSNCELDEFVVMPNHVHGIIVITDRRERSVTVPPDVNRVIQRTDGIKQSPGGDRNGYKPFPTQSHGLSEFIRGFKTFSSKRINQIQNKFLFQWQKSFHDHVIPARGGQAHEQELHNIRIYIKNNPINWETDRNNL